MFLHFPKQFDENEWAILFLVFFNLFLFITLPKRMSKELPALIILISLSFPKVMDHSIAVKPFSLYNITDTHNYEIFDILLYGAYPVFGYLFVYLYDYFKLKRMKLVGYIFIWSIIAIIMEFTLVKLHVYVYNGWKIIYSLPLYLIVLNLTLLFYIFIKSYNETHPFPKTNK